MVVNKHIILIGFMCSGKTTYGKLLAQALTMPFIDLDEYIVEKTGKSISTLFNENGEDIFRQMESSCLKDILQQKPAIIASGGGTPCFFNNMELINQTGISVYLKADENTLFNWIKESSTERPLLKGKTDDELKTYITNLLQYRKKYYEQAQITIPAINFDVNELLQLINKQLAG